MSTSALALFDRNEPDDANGFQAESARMILVSHQRLVQRPLLAGVPTGDNAGWSLYNAPFVVLAHDASPDPVFFYANLIAQRLFEMSWAQIVCLPSRLSAEPLARGERQRLLARVTAEGFIDDYAGVRISASGRRFRISGATVWNLLSVRAAPVGQAAAFTSWQWLS